MLNDFVQENLNKTDTAWSLLAEEEDPHVLSAIFWDWLNQLKVRLQTCSLDARNF